VLGVELVGFLDDDPTKRDQSPVETLVLGTLDQAAAIVREQQVDEVILALPLNAHERLVEIVRELQDLAVNVRVVPDLFDLSFIRTRVEDFEGVPLISLREPVLDPFQQAVKRSFDLVVGSLVLLLALPVMAVVTILIVLDSPGPILYNHKRVGQNGRIFTMYKFRSMIMDAEERQGEMVTHTEEGKILFKRRNDPRITRIGHFIRQTSLDELPQLINVLKGDMSLVGPRPELPWLVELYEPWQHKRFAVPQGMTGWWQVNGRSDKPMHLHVEEDLYYIQNYSLLLDIIILWRTVGAVFKRRGAY
jgi:exopolysaccharide biosynthesis polyprenyl glycosylphosphotransferase